MKPENPNEYLAHGLRWAVTESGLPLAAIAAGASISPDHLEALMAGKVSPRQETLVDLAEAVGYPISEIYAYGEAAAEGLSLTLCYADPTYRADVVSKAALGASLKRRSQDAEVLFLSLVQPAEWILDELDRLRPALAPCFSTPCDIPGLGSPEGYSELASLIDACQPSVVVLDNLARLHPDPPPEKKLEWFREADRQALRQLRESLAGRHRLDEVLVVHFVDRADAVELRAEGVVERIVSIDAEFLAPRWARSVHAQGVEQLFAEMQTELAEIRKDLRDLRSRET